MSGWRLKKKRIKQLGEALRKTIAQDYVSLGALMLSDRSYDKFKREVERDVRRKGKR